MSNLIFEKFVVFSTIGVKTSRTPIQIVTIDPARESAGLFSISSALLDLSGTQHFTWKPAGFSDQFDPALVGGSPYFKVKGKWDPAMTSPQQIRAQGAQGAGQVGIGLGGAAAVADAMAQGMQQLNAPGGGGVQDLTKPSGGKMHTPHFKQRLETDHSLHEKRGQMLESHQTLEFRVPHRKKDRLATMLDGLKHPIEHGGKPLYVSLGKLGPAPENKKSLMSSDSLGGLLEGGMAGAAAQGGESAAMLAVILGGGAVAAPVAVAGFVVVVGVAMSYQMIKAHRENLKQQMVFCRLTTVSGAAGKSFFPWEDKFYDINGKTYMEYPRIVEGPDLAQLVRSYML